MKDFYFKTLVCALIACLLPTLSNAQQNIPVNPVNIPINFYGKVIDQEGKPVVGAKVNLEVQANYFDENRSEQKQFPLETDQNGNFTLTGAYGAIVKVLSVEKEGFELTKKVKRGYSYTLPAEFQPDPNNPVVLKTWKQQGKEPLAHSLWHGKVVCDGTTNRFDLISGRPSPEGNLEIVCVRTPLKSPPPGNGRFDYKFEITVIGGGIRPAQDEFTYLAPEGDYSKSLTFSQKADDPKWDSKIPIPKEYYLKTADGHYGMLFVDWYAAQNSPTHLEWNISINPSGSRNLER
jgi:hypothetical protein